MDFVKAIVTMIVIGIFVGFLWQESCSYNKVISRHDTCVKALEKSDMTPEQFETCMGVKWQR